MPSISKSVFGHMKFVHANIEIHSISTIPSGDLTNCPQAFSMNGKQVVMQNHRHARIYHEIGLKVLSSGVANFIFVGKISSLWKSYLLFSLSL